jgi:hypothetical protein
MPGRIDNILTFNGFIFMFVSLSISIFAIFHNILLILKVWLYSEFVAQFKNYYFPILILSITIFSFYWFFIIQYRSYKKS